MNSSDTLNSIWSSLNECTMFFGTLILSYQDPEKHNERVFLFCYLLFPASPYTICLSFSPSLSLRPTAVCPCQPPLVHSEQISVGPSMLKPQSGAHRELIHHLSLALVLLRSSSEAHTVSSSLSATFLFFNYPICAQIVNQLVHVKCIIVPQNLHK